MKRSLRLAVIASLSLVACAGLLHLPVFRPLLATVAGCPFPVSDRVLSPEQAEELRVQTFAPKDAKGRALVKPALGFQLGKDDRRSIEHWARQHGVSCTPDRHGAGLRCAEVPAEAVGMLASVGAAKGGVTPSAGLLGFGFDAQGTLVSVQFSLSEADRERALELTQRAEESLALAGAPAARRESDLSGPLAQRQMLVALQDFRGEVRTTHMGRHYVVSHSYQLFYP